MHFCSKCLDCGWRNWFSFFLDGLQFLKHAAFEEGIANQRGLRLLWSNSKGFPHLTTTAQCLHQCQNTKQAWPPTFLPSLYNPHLSPHCHTAMLSTQVWSIVTWENPSDQCTDWYQHLFSTWGNEGSTQGSVEIHLFSLPPWKRKETKTDTKRRCS